MHLNKFGKQARYANLFTKGQAKNEYSVYKVHAENDPHRQIV